MHRRHASLAAVAAVIALLVAATTAGAVTWRPVFTGTNETITAIDYHSPTQLWFATDGGKVFVRQPDGSIAQQASFPGRQLFDLALRPSGDVALAAADNGRLLRYANGAWTTVSLANASYAHRCVGIQSPPLSRSTPTANLRAVGWSSDDIAWATTDDDGQVLKSVDAGVTWNDVSRLGNGYCLIRVPVTDVAPVPGSPDDIYFARSDGGGARTLDGLASYPSSVTLTGGNCAFGAVVHVAVDPAAGNRISGTGPCQYSWVVTAADSWRPMGPAGIGIMNDVAAAPGEFIAAGAAGVVKRTFAGFEPQDIPGRGSLKYTNWTAVDLADRDHAAIGGSDGTLALSDDAGPRPQFVLRGHGNHVSAQRYRRHVTVRVRARFFVPAGISFAQVCQGNVRITAWHGHRRLASRQAPLDAECKFSATVRAQGRRAARARRLRVSAFFPGNVPLGPGGRSVMVRVRR